MKIAAITDDGITISQHFGRAAYYLVATVENGEIVDRELREKLGHRHFSGEQHESDDHSQGHGFGAAAQDRHARMAESIKDCQAILCRGMGAGAYQSMQQFGIRPVVTEIENIDQAVKAFVSGDIVDHVEKLH